MGLAAAIVLFAYLSGSIAAAIVVSRLMALPDPRAGGSGNPGATNVLRLGGRVAAAWTLAGDILKGVVPVLLAHALSLPPAAIAATALAAFLGHLYPLYFGFRGGKGVATALGVVTALALPGGLAIAETPLGAEHDVAGTPRHSAFDNSVVGLVCEDAKVRRARIDAQAG